MNQKPPICRRGGGEGAVSRQQTMSTRRTDIDSAAVELFPPLPPTLHTGGGSPLPPQMISIAADHQLVGLCPRAPPVLRGRRRGFVCVTVPRPLRPSPLSMTLGLSDEELPLSHLPHHDPQVRPGAQHRAGGGLPSATPRGFRRARAVHLFLPPRGVLAVLHIVTVVRWMCAIAAAEPLSVAG